MLIFSANHGVPKMTTPLIEFIKRKREEKKASLQVRDLFSFVIHVKLIFDNFKAISSIPWLPPMKSLSQINYIVL